MKTWAALLLVLAAGLGALWQGTDGFQAVTTEAARRQAVARAPRTLPAATLQFASGRELPLARALRQDGRVTIVNFIYTRCNAVCSAMGGELQQLQSRLLADGLADRVRLLSISFDPADDAAQLAAYARRMRARPDLWQFAGVADAGQRRALLDAFGIVVVPAPLGEFEHNAAFHVVGADGRLARIVDYDAPDAALDLALAAAAPKLAELRR